MATALLATGDEIVHGDTLNTNGHYIAHMLSSEGIPIGMHMTCSDKKKDIIACLKFLMKHHNIIIIIGGLGPTTDDLTRFAVSEVTDDRLIQHKEAYEHIENRLKHTKILLDAGNLQQCLFPEHATLLPNPYGTAMGYYYYRDTTLFILLPGPPRECLPMFNDYAFPVLQKTHHSNKRIIKWRIFGLAESDIAAQLETALAGVSCQTGYRLDTPYIEFKVRCSEAMIHEVESIIDPILAPHIISSVDKKASQSLHDQLLSLKHPINIIDEATGGLLEHTLMTPELYPLLNFHPVDSANMSFHIGGLTEYWSGSPQNGETQLTISYSNQNQEGGETHTIPYRRNSVLLYAVEWLSFRLSHLINQLHQGIT